MAALRLATRGSDLARTQSLQAARLLEERTGLKSELVIVRTEGDRNQETALGEAGSIGLFTGEVQAALLDGRADWAVHSLKDLPASPAPGLVLAAVPPREDPRDLLLVRPEAFFPDRHPLLPLESRARIGTASARRKALVHGIRPDLETALLRGNVPTRVQRLRDGAYEAILLAAAGLKRLGLKLEDLRVVELDADLWPGAPGQGALALECREEDQELREALAALHDPETARAVEAERELLRLLGGGCALPLGAWAAPAENGGLLLEAVLGPTPDRPGAPPLVHASVQGPDPMAAAEAALAALQASERAWRERA